MTITMLPIISLLWRLCSEYKTQDFLRNPNFG